MEIYVHIPFCVKKCNYCDFNSFASAETDRAAYIKALLEEIEISENVNGDRTADTVFIGGGTPSILDAADIEKILSAIARKYVFTHDTEITVEVNPGTVTENKLKAYKNAGVNRLSIGVQSFNADFLRLLGRIHDDRSAISTFETARAAGFDNISMDIMTQLPGQTVNQVRSDLTKAVELQPEHLSVYSLIVEEGTPFWDMYKKDEIVLPSEEAAEEIDSLIHSYLENAGYFRYEVSNYAKKGYECRHNVGYWTRKAYRGYGVSAASLLRYEDGLQFRFTAERGLKDYISDHLKPLGSRLNAIENYRQLSREEQIEEFVFLGLRRCAGISNRDFENEFNISLNDIYSDILKKYIDMNFLKCTVNKDDTVYCFTETGMQLSNVILADFLLDA